MPPSRTVTSPAGTCSPWKAPARLRSPLAAEQQLGGAASSRGGWGTRTGAGDDPQPRVGRELWQQRGRAVALPRVVFSWEDLERAGDHVVRRVARWLRDLVLPRAGRRSPQRPGPPRSSGGDLVAGDGARSPGPRPLPLLPGLPEPPTSPGDRSGVRGGDSSLAWAPRVPPGWDVRGWPTRGGQRRVPASTAPAGGRQRGGCVHTGRWSRIQSSSRHGRAARE